MLWLLLLLVLLMEVRLGDHCATSHEDLAGVAATVDQLAVVDLGGDAGQVGLLLLLEWSGSFRGFGLLPGRWSLWDADYGLLLEALLVLLMLGSVSLDPGNALGQGGINAHLVGLVCVDVGAANVLFMVAPACCIMVPCHCDRVV